MSAPASPIESQYERRLDVEHMIIAIQERPPSWNKHSKEYSDRDLKTRLWQEVCQNVVQNWDELNNQYKKNTGADIQRKWKNLKDCFSRELASQKKCESGQSAKKKRNYIYFDQLSFLISTTTPRDTSGNIKSIEECANLEIESDDDNISQTQDSWQALYRRQTSTQARKENANEEALLDILRKKQILDEDVSFAEMLIRMLRKLNEDQKFYAKIEILNAMDLVYPGSMQTVPQNVCPGSSTGMQTVPPAIYLGAMQMTSATYINSEPGTSSSLSQDSDDFYDVTMSTL